jgi:hypothetical protein
MNFYERGSDESEKAKFGWAVTLLLVAYSVTTYCEADGPGFTHVYSLLQDDNGAISAVGDGWYISHFDKGGSILCGPMFPKTSPIMDIDFRFQAPGAEQNLKLDTDVRRQIFLISRRATTTSSATPKAPERRSRSASKVPGSY